MHALRTYEVSLAIIIVNIILCVLWYSLDISQHIQDHDSCFHLVVNYVLVFVPAP